MIAFSTIKIEIKNLGIHLPKQNGRYINEKYEVIIKLYILKKIKILNLSITKTFMERKKISDAIKEFNRKFKENRNQFDKKSLRSMRELKIEIENFDLKMKLGTEDAATTAILIGVISSGLGIILRNKKENLKNLRFETIPIYQDKNILKIDFSGIFKIKMIHIIYIIYILKKKRRVEKDVRPSDRRAYAYSNE